MEVSETKTSLCAQHGEYESRRLLRFGIWTGCKQCQLQAEEVERTEREREAAEREFARRASRAAKLLEVANLPPRFADRRLSNYRPTCDTAKRALAAITEYANGFDEALESGASLILCGGVGTGKTHLAVGIAHAVLARDRPAIYTSVMAAVRAVKDTYRRDAERSEAEVIADFVSPDLLILDEVGVQFGSDTEKLILFEIINGRYEHFRPTVVVSNLAKDSLVQFLGERVIDRLREGGGKMVLFDWQSYRR
ncbi:ATP-binding protein [Cupriavidus sp. H18C2]|uniref:ATP-binding protein n=1 Tax=Cupriavidus sp. H18C2 TaxID=3241602 RepID=UPI003BF8837C